METARSRACDFHLQRGEGIVDSGNRVVAKLGGVCVLDLSSIYRVASHTRVHRLPSGKVVGRQGETTGFILHKSKLVRETLMTGGEGVHGTRGY